MVYTKRGETCSVEGCDRAVWARTYCGKHYRAWHAHGDPTYRVIVPLDVRIWEKIEKTDDCWLWTGALSSGYGVVGYEGRHLRVHRVVYELLVGPIPEGLTLDHLCRVRSCCRPEHLEPVTATVNKERGESPAAKNARKTHCNKGHEYTEANTMLDAKGKRRCRRCNLDRYYALKEKAAAEG